MSDTPALTAEDRAKDICDEMDAETSARMSGDDWATLEALIASAIREAEDAALERAWREITMTALANAEGASADFTNGLVVAADRVRTLKSRKETP